MAVISMIILATIPTLALFIHLPSDSEKFSELWILDSEHKTENYPFNVSITEIYNVYLVVKNHMGYSSYDRIYIKFRNSTGSLPNMMTATPSTLPSYYKLDLFVKDEAMWETSMTFTILETTFGNGSLTVRQLLINDIPLSLQVSSTWDTTRIGYYYHLFFELWHYDLVSRNFVYHNRFVGIWLNVTV